MICCPYDPCCKPLPPYLPTVVIRGDGETNPKAFGGRYSQTQAPLTLTANVPYTLPLIARLIGNGVDYTDPDTLTITKSGVYEINYSASGSSSAAADLTLSAVRNGGPLPAGSITQAVTADSETQLIGTTYAYLNAGDELSLNLTTSADTTITPSQGTNSILTVKQLS